MVIARDLARLVRRLVTVVLVVAGARSLLGVFLSSVALSAVWLWFGVRAWYRWENRFRRPRPLVPEISAPHPGPTIPDETPRRVGRCVGRGRGRLSVRCEHEPRTP